jgi:hypothetical protein
MANIVIDIASEFTGAKAFKQADSATQKLTSGVKKLAGAIGLAYSGTQILAFGKASVKAAAADQKAQQQLALALKNVGLERDSASAEGFIQRLQSEFGIVDDLLRPAYQSLAIATRDTAESQRLLNLSLDISAATGKDLGSVTAALSKAYLGNNTALTRLGVGISKADLKTKSFYEITSDLADTFKGSATAAASTFQGSMDKLAVASANVQEIIGTGLIDALTNLGNNDSVANLASSMEDTAEYTADVIRGIGVLADKLKSLPGFSNLNVGMIPILGSYLQGLRGLGQASQIKPKPFTTPMTISGQSTKVTAAQTKVAKETLKVSKDQLKLSKAKAIFDLQKIQIEAALKGKISEEERIRLLLMRAIEDENIGQIEKYTKLLDEAQAKTVELTKTLAAVNNIKIQDPFAEWVSSANNSQKAIEQMSAAMMRIPSIIQANGREWSSFTGLVANTSIQSNLREWSSTFSPSATNPNTMPNVDNSNLPNVNVIVQGTVLSQQELQAAVMEAVNQSGITGNPGIFGPIGQSVSL